MKVVEENNIIKKERIKSNTKLFNKEDIGRIVQNIDLVSKIYVLGLLDK